MEASLCSFLALSLLGGAQFFLNRGEDIGDFRADGGQSGNDGNRDQHDNQRILGQALALFLLQTSDIRIQGNHHLRKHC